MLAFASNAELFSAFSDHYSVLVLVPVVEYKFTSKIKKLKLETTTKKAKNNIDKRSTKEYSENLLSLEFTGINSLYMSYMYQDKNINYF